jgi:hypothetical protein
VDLTMTTALSLASVIVSMDGRSLDVDLRHVPRSARDGAACLADIWRCSRLPHALHDVAFDLVGDDGFRVSRKCGAHLVGRALVHGFVDRQTRRISWDDSVVLPCFFRVKALARLVATPQLATTRTLRPEMGGGPPRPCTCAKHRAAEHRSGGATRT